MMSLAPTPAAQWAAGALYTLPSGNVARLKQPGLLGLIAAGFVPNPVTRQIARFLNASPKADALAINNAVRALGRGELTPDQVAELVGILQQQQEGRPEGDDETVAHYEQSAASLYAIAQLCLVEPKLVAEPDYAAGEIGPGDLSQADYWWLANAFVEGRADDLVPFRVGIGPAAAAPAE